MNSLSKVKSWYSDSIFSIVLSVSLNTSNNLDSLSGYLLRLTLLDPILIYLIPSKEVGIFFALGISNTTNLLPS